LTTTRLADAIDALEARSDPRLTDEFWRTVPAEGERSPAILVGVVHDHPASSFRIQAVASAFAPEVLALELPDLAVPAFERVAEERSDDEGGEMSAAIAATPGATAVGVDAVGPRFLVRLARNAREDDASLGTVRDVVREVGGIARHAVACRLDDDDVRANRSAGDHEVSVADEPAAQADDERSTVARSRALLGAVQRPHADLLLDGTREETMATRIDVLREDGPVLAVVGMNHLDSVASQVS
jgi:hypothetical protein